MFVLGCGPACYDWFSTADHDGMCYKPSEWIPPLLASLPHWFYRAPQKVTWVWVNTYRYIFRGMNIHLPAISGFTRYQGFDPSPYIYQAVQPRTVEIRLDHSKSALYPRRRILQWRACLVACYINGNSRILKWRYVSTILLAIFCGDIPLQSLT